MEHRAPIERDVPLTCQECGRTFVWTVGDQRYYFKKGRPTPRYCRDCRLDAPREAPSPSRFGDLRNCRA